MGEVYRARDPRLGREVAIKVLPSRLMQDSEALSRFEREAKAVAVLSHPNVLAIHDIGRHEGIAYAVMELLEGDTLRRKLDAGPVSLTEAIDLALQTTNGLSAAHEKGIVHRDLKPENLFVTGDGRVKILDFGLAKRIQEVAVGEETTAPTQTGQTTPGTVMGTLGYMSPEQVRGLPLDHRSDIFSFGVVLYEMVTGRRPFPGSSAAEVAGAILRAEPTLDDAAIPARLKPVIRRLLEKDPAKRYAGIREVNADLRSLEESLAPARGRGLSRNAWIAVAVAVVAAAAAGAWFWQRASRARWALETAAPEIRRLLAAEDFPKAMALTREARAVLPKDPTLKSLWNQATREVTVRSDPPGAKVSMRPYGDSAAWQSLGSTPLEKIRVPRNIYQYLWRIAKPGFATAYRIGPGTSLFRLRPEKSVPPEMVVVTGGDVEIEIPGLDHAPTVPLEDYLLDRHEVTNEEYKRFVDAGGYQDRRFWKEPFGRDGRTVSWEEALGTFRDATGRLGPATWEVGAFPKGMEKYPVAGVSWYEAAAYAEFAGKVLPTIYHWNHAAQTPLGSLMVRGSNFRGAGTQPVESPGSLSGFGTADMAGNVKEWCWNEGRGGKRFILGGGFGEPEYMFIDEDAQSPWDRRPNFGFRCAKLFSPPPDSALGRFEVEFRDYSKEKPVSDEVFTAFKRPYVYDRRDLDARVEESKTTPDWVREKVTFSAAYGDERVIAYLYLPKTGTPPLQAVVFFPGSDVIFQDKFDDQQSVVWDFVVRSGRVLMFPIFKSTLERRDGLKSDVPQPTANWRDHMILWSKDLSRSVDYLETRKDIDRSKLGYFGLSWGAAVAPILLATEERFQAAILEGGGLAFQRALPEADPINFVTRVKIPVLMINGRFDNFFPVETSQVPLFRLLGAPEKDKRHRIWEVGHVVLQKEAIRESLDWLDKYMGPVRQ